MRTTQLIIKVLAISAIFLQPVTSAEISPVLSMKENKCNTPQFISAINFAREKPRILATFFKRIVSNNFEVLGTPMKPKCFKQTYKFLKEQKPLHPLRESVGASMASFLQAQALAKQGYLAAKNVSVNATETALLKYGKFNKSLKSVAVLTNVLEVQKPFLHCIDYVIAWIMDCSNVNNKQRARVYDEKITHAGAAAVGNFAVFIGVKDFNSNGLQDPLKSIRVVDEGRTYDSVSSFRLILEELNLREVPYKPYSPKVIMNRKPDQPLVDFAGSKRKLPPIPVKTQLPPISLYMEVVELIQSDSSANCTIGSLANIIGPYNGSLTKTMYKCGDDEVCQFMPSYAKLGKCYWSAGCCKGGWVYMATNRVLVQNQTVYTPAQLQKSDNSAVCPLANMRYVKGQFNPVLMRTNYKCKKETQKCGFGKPYAHKGICYWSAVCCKQGFIYMAVNEMLSAKQLSF